MRHWQTAACVAVTLLALGAGAPATARTSNGNDFALYFVEARTDRERKDLLDDALGRPHFFRYLQIMNMREGLTNGCPYVEITAFEPASYMDVEFTVTKRVSLDILSEKPKSKLGDAIAVTGCVREADPERNVISLHPVIVRHKDRLSSKIGKELLCEVDPGATFYSYTGGKRPVSLTYKDRDLLKHENRILKQGQQAWADFLEQELARRERARATERAQRKAAEEAARKAAAQGGQ